MANFISIKEAMDLCAEKGNSEVAIRGWVYRERGSNKFKFLVIRDSSNIIQCVVKKENLTSNSENSAEELWDKVSKLQIEASVKIIGEIKKDERAPTGYEIQVKDIKIIGVSDTFPINKDQSTEFLLDKRHLWLRSRHLTAVMKVRSTIFGALNKFYRSKGFYEFSPPVFTPNACEGGATLFEVKYFEEKCYLTQSWQLYAEAAIFALEKIYFTGPCFRAERSKTSRHLAEFWMAETECAWYDLPKISELAKELVAFIIEEVVKNNENDLKLLGQDIEKLKKITLPFPTITYTEALKILKEKSNMDVEWGKDLRTIEEDELMKHFDKPIVVTHYPKEIMAFYKPADPKDPKTTLCFDMLAPEGYGEIIGGSQRETDLEALKKGLEKEGEKLDNYEWYLDLRRYGNVPHAGFGMGVERVVAWLCKLENIKDAIPFPRTMLRKTP
ncbi:TPA: asparagine--tRNA ligase [Candidatus Woesearchaeota archaeon]|nr:asparagine--tRNA ligase [Candidatus Woesearchaeota archaeon]